MRFWSCIWAVLLLFGCGKAYEVNPEFIDNEVKENAQILYSPAGVYWSDGGMPEDRILFTKHISSGSGSYSEYVAEKEAPLYMPTNYEFLFEGRLIGYNSANLKFFEARYEDGTFIVSELSEEQVRYLFPQLEIIKISEAKDGVLKIKKRFWQTKSVLLLNDTKQDFHRYSFEKKDEYKPFKSLLTIDGTEDIIYSHMGSRDELFPILKIKVEL